MSDDIVERLRVWSDNAKEQDANEIVVGLCQAADEIERLRNDLDGSQLAYRGASYDRDRLRAERDDARRMYCEQMSRRPTWFADEMGWDCYKEKP